MLASSITVLSALLGTLECVQHICVMKESHMGIGHISKGFVGHFAAAMQAFDANLAGGDAFLGEATLGLQQVLQLSNVAADVKIRNSKGRICL